MAKAVALVSALCILAFASLAHASPEVFDVEGQVYCDPCRLEFETRLSEKVAGAIVRLECKSVENGSMTYSVESKTDAKGHYSLTVEGDHENDYCEVILLESPRDDCKELMKIDRARIECTENSGMHTVSRYANPLGFMKKQAVPECQKVIKELGLFPLEE